VIARILAGVIAVVGAAALTLGAVIALVWVTIDLVAIENIPLLVMAVVGDVLLGTLLLVACIYLATHLAVRILGVGHSPLPELPSQMSQDESPKA
jgi:hypothetical protein